MQELSLTVKEKGCGFSMCEILATLRDQIGYIRVEEKFVPGR